MKRHYWIVSLKLRTGAEAYFAGLTAWRHGVEGIGDPPGLGCGTIVDWNSEHVHAVCFEREQDAEAIRKSLPDGARVIECGDGYWVTP